MRHRRAREGEGEQRSGSQETGCGDGEASHGDGMAPALVGVGVGPGDPELVTLQALRALRDADRVFAPSLSLDAVGRAESIVREAAPEVQVERLVIEMRRDGGTSVYGEAAGRIAVALEQGERVAFATLGDPNVYSTFSSLAREVRARGPRTPIETVAGIMAFQALAARAGSVVLEGTESLALITALDGPEALDGALADPTRAIAVYKGGRHLPAIAKRLAQAGRLDGAVGGELLGLPGERAGSLGEIADAPATYLATVLVPPAGRT
jgi:precorrin-2/cobalt-factor-2 C20-methyltransferase